VKIKRMKSRTYLEGELAKGDEICELKFKKLSE